MKRLYFFFLLLAFIGCNNSEDKGDFNECISLLQTAESCNQKSVELPCGLRFGINRKEMISLFEILVKDKNSCLKKKDNQYIYLFKANNNIYECNIIGYASSDNPFDSIAPINKYIFVFDNSCLSFRGDKERLFDDMKSEFKDFDFAYCQFDYTRHEIRNRTWHNYKCSERVYCWTSQSLAVVLSDFFTLSITFYNAPITNPSRDLRSVNSSIKEIEEEEQREKVQFYKEKKYNSH